MTEEQIKLLCKLAIENSRKQLTNAQKETLKQAIDESKTVEDLFVINVSDISEDIIRAVENEVICY